MSEFSQAFREWMQAQEMIRGWIQLHPDLEVPDFLKRELKATEARYRAQLEQHGEAVEAWLRR